MRASSPRAVLVAYRALHTGVHTASGPVFLWPFDEPPATGTRIVLPGVDGREEFGVVVREATQAEVDRERPSAPEYSVIRLATEDELRAANEQHAAASERFWAQARIAAGIEGGRRFRVVSGFPPLYPRGGAATPAEVATYMAGWRRVWKRAENEQRPANELRAYEAIARYWTSLHRHGIRA